jgi:hypothetical protein
MNDAEELRTGRRALAQHFAARKAQLEPWQIKQLADLGVERDEDAFATYLLSASVAGDLLTMWRNYGGREVAFSIGLDTGAALKPVIQVAGWGHPCPPEHYYDDSRIELGEGEYANNDPDSPFVFGGRWTPVDYIEGETNPAVQKTFDALLNGLVNPATPESKRPVFTAPLGLGGSPTDYWKHVGFQDERELRAAWQVNPDWKFVRYRPSRFGLLPFIEVATEHSSDADPDVVPDSTRLPIREVMIGPSPFAADAVKALRGFLDSSGYGDVAISRSVTPYR